MQTTAVKNSEITETLLRIARELYKEGPGMAQEPVALRQAASALNASTDIRLQQQILTAWHRLFQEGRLIWGYDITNPGHPFYHFPEWVEHENSSDRE
jgi:hypothetical protein